MGMRRSWVAGCQRCWPAFSSTPVTAPEPRRLGTLAERAAELGGCCWWSGGRVFRQDIGDGSGKTSAAGLAGHRRRRTVGEVRACPRPPGPHRPARRPATTRRGRRPLRCPPLLGLQAQARDDADGEAAFEPRLRRPETSPTAIPPATVALTTSLRGKRTPAGLDAGPTPSPGTWPTTTAPPPRRPPSAAP